MNLRRPQIQYTQIYVIEGSFVESELDFQQRTEILALRLIIVPLVQGLSWSKERRVTTHYMQSTLYTRDVRTVRETMAQIPRIKSNSALSIPYSKCSKETCPSGRLKHRQIHNLGHSKLRRGMEEQLEYLLQIRLSNHLLLLIIKESKGKEEDSSVSRSLKRLKRCLRNYMR